MSDPARARSARRLRVLISAGPTREPIDAVRFISNYSTGVMGARLVTEARRRGHRVTLVSGPTDVEPPRGTRTIWVERTREMRAALRIEARRADAILMAAAVCDFEAARSLQRKFPRRGQLRLHLKATPDIVKTLPRRPGQLVVGFALETSRAVARAAAKLRSKHLDLIVGQQVNGSRPFGERPVEAFFVHPAGAVTRLGKVSKAVLARAILDEIEQLWYGGTTRGQASRGPHGHASPRHGHGQEEGGPTHR